MAQVGPLTAAEEWFEREYGGPAESLDLDDVTITTTPQEVLPNDPERLMYLLVNCGAVDITINGPLGVTPGAGIRLASNGGSVAVHLRDDGPLTAEPVHAVVAAGSAVLKRRGMRRQRGLARG